MTAPGRVALVACSLLAAALAARSDAAVAADRDTPVLEPGPAHQAAHSAAANALVARIESLAEARDAAGVVDVARETFGDPGLDDAARERALHSAALALAELDGTADARALLEALRVRAPALRVWFYDGPHRLALPLYDVAAAARFALRRQEERRALDQAIAEIARGGDGPLALFDAQADAASPQRRAVVRAFEAAPAATLSLYRERLSVALERGTDVEIAAVVARRLGDTALMGAAIDRADAAIALANVLAIRATFAAADALDLLERATRREDVASTALLEIGALAQTEPHAREILFRALEDDVRAGSAAAALAGLHEAGVAASLRDWVLTQADERRARRGILALRLDGSDAARAELARLAADSRLEPALRAEASR